MPTPSDTKATPTSEPTKLCCNVHTLASCLLCGKRWCRECWGESRDKDTPHFNYTTLYSCPDYPKTPVVVITSDGTDFMGDRIGGGDTTSPYVIARHKDHPTFRKATRSRD